MSNQQLPEELYQKITRNFEKRKVYSSFKDNIYGADLLDLKLISKFNKIICFLTCITNANAFHKTLDESNRKLSKIRVEKGSEFYNR